MSKQDYENGLKVRTEVIEPPQILFLQSFKYP